MTSNIYSIDSMTDLGSLIKENPGRFIIMGMVCSSVNKTKCSIIKTLLKRTAEKNQQFLFLYYKVQESEMGINTLVPKDKTVYPLCYYLINTNILAEIKNVDEKTFISSFEQCSPKFYEALNKKVAENTSVASTEPEKTEKVEETEENFQQNMLEQQKKNR